MSKLQDIRKEKGLSQSQLANLAGVSKRSLQEYEQGARDINKAKAIVVLALADALGVEVRDLLEIE